MVLRTLYILVFSLCSFCAIAQQQSQTTYTGILKGLENFGSIHDADYISLYSSIRSQWTGIEGNPNNQRVSVVLPTHFYGIGYGLNLSNESIGFQNRTHIKGAITKRFSIKDALEVQIGFLAGLLSTSIDGDELVTRELDPLLPSTSESFSTFTYDIAFGLKYKNWELSTTVQSLNQPVIESSGVLFGSENVKGVLIVSNKSQINNNFDLQTFLILNSDIETLQSQIETGAWYKERFYIGLGYRGIFGTQDAVPIRIGGSFKELKAYYTYEVGLSSLSSFHQNTHDIGVEYRIKNRISKQRKRVVIENSRF